MRRNWMLPYNLSLVCSLASACLLVVCWSMTLVNSCVVSWHCACLPFVAAINVSSKLKERYGLNVAAEDIKLPEGQLVSVRLSRISHSDSQMRCARSCILFAWVFGPTVTVCARGCDVYIWHDVFCVGFCLIFFFFFFVCSLVYTRCRLPFPPCRLNQKFL
jgi:hypothetical protein